jgi:hypothetical protein
MHIPGYIASLSLVGQTTITHVPFLSMQHDCAAIPFAATRKARVFSKPVYNRFLRL